MSKKFYEKFDKCFYKYFGIMGIGKGNQCYSDLFMKDYFKRPDYMDEKYWMGYKHGVDTLICSFTSMAGTDFIDMIKKQTKKSN